MYQFTSPTTCSATFPCYLHAEDPFKGLLSSGTAAHTSSSSSTPKAAAGDGSSSSRFLLPPDPLTDASASLAAAFSRQDVANLLAVLANKVSHCLAHTIAAKHRLRCIRACLVVPVHEVTVVAVSACASLHSPAPPNPNTTATNSVPLSPCPQAPLPHPKHRHRVWRRTCTGQLQRSCWQSLFTAPLPRPQSPYPSPPLTCPNIHLPTHYRVWRRSCAGQLLRSCWP